MYKTDKREFKGFLFALLAAFALANSFIFSKLAFKELDFYQFGFWWFLLGTLWNLGYFFFAKQNQGKSKIAWYQALSRPLIFIIILEAVATGLFYKAILIMENPGVVSFIGNIGPVFVTVLGLIFLSESFSIIQFLGIILALTGIFTLNYQGFQSVNEILIPGSEYVILASLLFSIASVIARKNHKKLDASLLSSLRAIVLLFIFVVLILFQSNINFPSYTTFIFLSLGSFLEVFITVIFAYLSFKYIEAFKTSIILSTKGIFALLSSWLILNLQVHTFQIVGGLLSLAGVILVSKNTKKT